MPRVVSLFLPNWSTNRLRRKLGAGAPSPEAPLVLIGRHANQRVIFAADRAAQAAGLRVGMAASKAQALVANLTLHDADTVADEAALERLAVWALRYSPIVASDPPDGLVIDTTGADHLHGGEATTLSGLVDRMHAAGITARVAVADSWGAAHAVARLGLAKTAVVPVGKTREVIAPLPLAALRLPGAMLRCLRVLGFTRVADVLDLPRAPLALRFGPELARRLDQALGFEAEPIVPVRLPELIETRRAFGEPIGAAETIARYIGKLVTPLCQTLEARGLGARRLDLICHRVDSQLQAVRVGMGMPVRDAKRLNRLLCDKIETIDPGFGIELMTLTATLAEPLPDKQVASALIEEPEPDISGLIDVLSNRLGAKRLYRAAPVETDVPERSVIRIPALAPAQKHAWPSDWPRPARLLAAPEAIETVALLPDHPPITFTWRGIRRRVKRADGPERVFGEWWKRDAELAAVRDYFQVEDEAGERYWIFRAGDGEDAATGSQRWFLHGVFG
jgi:protein ImuB